MNKELKPEPKVQATINFSALATVCIGVFAVIYPELYDRFPPALEGAIVGFIASLSLTGNFCLGYTENCAPRDPVP